MLRAGDHRPHQRLHAAGDHDLLRAGDRRLGQFARRLRRASQSPARIRAAGRRGRCGAGHQAGLLSHHAACARERWFANAARYVTGSQRFPAPGSRVKGMPQRQPRRSGCMRAGRRKLSEQRAATGADAETAGSASCVAREFSCVLPGVVLAGDTVRLHRHSSD